MTTLWFFFMVIGVMSSAGLLGGMVNFLLIPKAEAEGTTATKSVALGIGASFLVPLFLNMISSNLLDSIRNAPGEIVKILVFAGFCLVAAISSTSFIKGISDRILKEAQEAKAIAQDADKKATEVQVAVEPIIEKETEVDHPLESAVRALSNLESNEKDLLDKLANGRWVLRTRTGLAEESGLSKPEVNKLIEELRNKGYVKAQMTFNKSGEKRTRWYITNRGREVLG